MMAKIAYMKMFLVLVRSHPSMIRGPPREKWHPLKPANIAPIRPYEGERRRGGVAISYQVVDRISIPSGLPLAGCSWPAIARSSPCDVSAFPGCLAIA